MELYNIYKMLGYLHIMSLAYTDYQIIQEYTEKESRGNQYCNENTITHKLEQ